MIGPARLSCRSGIGRSGASRSGALLSALDEVSDKQVEGGVDVGAAWSLSLSDNSRRSGNTVGEGPNTGWTIP